MEREHGEKSKGDRGREWIKETMREAKNKDME
jgi:hypothetical protein